MTQHCERTECVWCQPTLNSPYDPPERHWTTEDGRATDDITSERRPPRAPMPLGRRPEPTQADLYTGNIRIVDRLRHDVAAWRGAHWKGATEPSSLGRSST